MCQRFRRSRSNHLLAFLRDQTRGEGSFPPTFIDRKVDRANIRRLRSEIFIGRSEKELKTETESETEIETETEINM